MAIGFVLRMKQTWKLHGLKTHIGGVFYLKAIQFWDSKTISPQSLQRKITTQRAKKVVSDSLGLVDFAIRLVIFVPNLPDGQHERSFLENPNYRRIVINPANQKGFWG